MEKIFENKMVKTKCLARLILHPFRRQRSTIPPRREHSWHALGRLPGLLLLLARSSASRTPLGGWKSFLPGKKVKSIALRINKTAQQGSGRRSGRGYEYEHSQHNQLDEIRKEHIQLATKQNKTQQSKRKKKMQKSLYPPFLLCSRFLYTPLKRLLNTPPCTSVICTSEGRPQKNTAAMVTHLGHSRNGIRPTWIKYF